jgi:squalene cyclase
LGLRTILLVAAVNSCWAQRPVASEPEQRALAFLVEEVPRWARENGCFSCHNNGDGARALYAAMRLGRAVPPAALAETTAWLREPSQWDSGPANPAFSDRKLTRIQFAAALAEAFEAGQVTDRRTLAEAAESLLPFQEPDGSWRVDAGAMIGSPATYGPALATYMALRSLETADAARFARPVARARGWLQSQDPTSSLERAVVALALFDGDPKRVQLLRALVRGQNGDGGWGTYAEMPSEVFDSAVALLALVNSNDDAGRRAVQRGREFLMQRQLPSGGWPETTRPSGGQSYAQHISTSAWATLALLAIDAEGQ